MNKGSRTLIKLILSALFAALMIVGAFIRIPTPIIAITFQLQVALLAGVLLSGEWGFISITVYLILGLIGLPVFTQGGGIAYVLKPSFGYLAAFPFGALSAGLVCKLKMKKEFLKLLVAFLVGSAVIYVIGTTYCIVLMKTYLESPDSVFSLLISCAGLPLLKDILLCVPFALLAQRLLPITSKLRR